MAIRAYFVKELVTNDQETFDWHDENLFQFLEENGVSFHGVDENGFVWIRVDVLEDAIDQAEELQLPEELVEALKKDVAEAKSQGKDSILYFCY